MIFSILFLVCSVNARIFPSELGSGYYDDEKVYDGFDEKKPTADHKGSLTSTFLPVAHFTLINGTQLKYPNNGVPRLVDYDGDGLMDLLIAAQGKVYLHLQTADGKMSTGTALKTVSGDIDTADRADRYTGFAYADINGDGLKDIILSKGYHQDLVYYPAVPSECRNGLGRDYMGRKYKTVTGKICQRWDSQTPHSHTRNNPENFPDSTLQEAQNYCRNPDSETGGPWCYTVDSNKRWEYCGVPQCSPATECVKSRHGGDYSGNKQKTKSGYTCQEWKLQTPNMHKYEKPDLFPDGTMDEAANYCRNPDYDEAPWCYTTNGSRWEYCDFTVCGASVYGSAVSLNIRTGYMRFDLADWDQDGDLDVVVGDGNIFLYNNTGSESSPEFSQTNKTPILPFGSRSYSRYPRMMDLDRDGKIDFIESINWGDITLGLHGPKGRFRPIKMRIAMGDKIYTRRPYGEHQAVDLNDVNGDGIIDLVTCGDTGQVLYFQGVQTEKYIPPLIEQIIAEYPTGLGQAVNSNDTVYNAVYNGHKNIQDLVNMISTTTQTKNNVYNWYKQHVNKYPKYFKRQQWTDDEPCLAQLSGYIWNIMWETRDKSDSEARTDLATATNQTGVYKNLLVDRSIFYIDNTRATSPKADWLYSFLMKKDPSLYSLSYLTHKGYFIGRNHKFGCERDSCVNVAGYETYSYSQFPADCQVCSKANRSPKMTNYITIVAHEVAHNEADQELAEAWKFEIYQRKFLLLKKGVEGHVKWRTNPEDGYDKSATKSHFKDKGWWNGTEDWDTAASRHFTTGAGKDLNFNMIRGSMWFFVKSPQEAFATLANQYFADAKLMLDFAVERSKRGYPLNIDWFLLVADYYSKGGSTFPMFRIGEMYLDATILKYEATLERSDGFISKVIVPSGLDLPGPTTYTFTLDNQGLVQNCETA